MLVSAPKTSNTTGTRCVYLLYDERMTLHRPINWTGIDFPASKQEIPDNYTFENPERIRSIHARLMEREKTLLLASSSTGEHDNTPSKKQRFCPIACQPASKETILLAHSDDHYNRLRNTIGLSDEDLEKLSQEDEDIYYCHSTFMVATLACGGLVECVNAVTSDEDEHSLNRAIALIRPPGHHACQEQAMGFCFFNSVAVAAKYALATQRASRVLILDWDIHHGNGTQDLTYDDPNICYVSLHRYATGNGYYFPSTGNYSEVGPSPLAVAEDRGDDDVTNDNAASSASASGTNANVAWTQGGMGNTEYAAAFCELILPILDEFAPDLILVSSGFDAAKGDLIGDCELTPDMYHALVRSILETAVPDIPIVVALEGGYNINVISTCMEAVAMALLDEKWEDDAHIGVNNDELLQVNNVVAANDNENENLVANQADRSSNNLHHVVLPTPVDNTKTNHHLTAEGAKSVSAMDDGTTLLAPSRLQKGREELEKYWRYNEEKTRDRGTIKMGASRSINKTIGALQQTSRWNSHASLFRKVAGGKLPPKQPKSETQPRSVRTRSKSQSEKQQIEVNELDDLFDSLAL